MSGDADHSLILAGMTTVCQQTAEEAMVHPDEVRRAYAILVYLSSDARASSLAAAVIRDAGHSAPPSPAEEAAMAVFCHHPTLVRALRSAGYEISDAKDPGPGRMAAVFVVGGRCARQAIVMDPALVANEEARKAALEALPGEVVAAIADAVPLARRLRDATRRQRDAIVVCECNDAKACEVILAIPRGAGVMVEPVPGAAAALICPHEDAARVARALGYTFTDAAPPRIGWMRVFIFASGRVIATAMMIEEPEDVARAEEDEGKIGAEYARRIFREKEHLISRAAGALLATPGLRSDQLVVVFGSDTAKVRAIYRELAALPAMKGFPLELPDGVPAALIPYESFMQTLRRHGVDAAEIDAATLGPNQVRVATFTPNGIYIQKMEALAVSRGGSA